MVSILRESGVQTHNGEKTGAENWLASLGDEKHTDVGRGWIVTWSAT